MRFLFLGLLVLTPAVVRADDKAKDEPVPGYRKQSLEGFTLLVNQEVLDHNDDKDFRRKPLDALQIELQHIARVMTPRALRALRRVLIWVEWDEQKAMSNGRQGNALAVYYGGHQAAMLGQGKHPLKAKAVTVLRMKDLTREHQPGRDSGRCVLLHEISHAVHDQLLGFNNPLIKAAYRQAMERKLYDRGLYVATNEAEFFAELTCAYLDRLDYFPRNRDDLRKHDPASYKVLDQIWGKATQTAKGDDPDNEPTTPMFNIDLSLDRVTFGRVLSGAAPQRDALKGKVVALLFFTARSAKSMADLARYAKLEEELGPYGLTVVGVHGTPAPPEEVTSALRSRELTLPVLDGVRLQIAAESFPVPHLFLFDHTGKCVHRDAPSVSEDAVRREVGEALVAATKRAEFSPLVEPVVKAFREGQPPVGMLARLAPMVRSSQAEVAEQARQLADLVLAPAEKTYTDAEGKAESDPAGAYVMLEPLSATFRGTRIAARSAELMNKLKRTKPVQTELTARRTLDVVKALDARLSGQDGAFDPTSAAFRQKNGTLLRQLQETVQKMKQTWPETPATAAAGRIAAGYGLAAP